MYCKKRTDWHSMEHFFRCGRDSLCTAAPPPAPPPFPKEKSGREGKIKPFSEFLRGGGSCAQAMVPEISVKLSIVNMYFVLRVHSNNGTEFEHVQDKVSV